MIKSRIFLQNATLEALLTWRKAHMKPTHVAFWRVYFSSPLTFSIWGESFDAGELIARCQGLMCSRVPNSRTEAEQKWPYSFHIEQICCSRNENCKCGWRRRLFIEKWNCEVVYIISFIKILKKRKSLLQVRSITYIHKISKIILNGKLILFT